MRVNTWTSAFIGGLIGATLMVVGQRADLHMKPVEMSYNDWAGVLLAAAALVVTAVGVVMAIAAIWGFSGIKTGAEVAAVEHVSDRLTKGDLGDRLDKAFTKFLDDRMKDGKLRQLLEDRVDLVLFNGPAVRAGEEDEDIDPELEEQA